MKAQKITFGESSKLSVSSLPTRPTAPSAFGGKGYTAVDMKAAFDRLPLFIIERYNALLDDISAEPSASVSQEIKTGITETHTLSELFSDITSGSILNYTQAFGTTLAEYLLAIRNDIDELARKVGITLGEAED